MRMSQLKRLFYVLFREQRLQTEELLFCLYFYLYYILVSLVILATAYSILILLLLLIPTKTNNYRIFCNFSGQAIKQFRALTKKPLPFLTPIAFLSFTSQSKPTMSSEKSALDDLLQNADQLFDENQYQEALDALNKYTVLIRTFFSLFFVNVF